MTYGLELWDAAIGEDRKQRGMRKAVESAGPLVIRGRELAVEIAKAKGTVCMDCVTAALMKAGYGRHALRNAAGHLLAGDHRLVPTGDRIKSKRPWANGNLIRTYRLK